MGNGRLASGAREMTKVNLGTSLLTSTSSATGVDDHLLSEGAEVGRFAELEVLFECDGEWESGEVGSDSSH